MKDLIRSDIPKQISVIRHLYNEYLTWELHHIGIDNIVPSHGDIIITLFTHGELTLKELSQKIRRDKSTVTSLVNKLEKKGLVMLKPNPSDRRSRFICLSEKGKNLKDAFIKISNNMNNILLKDISEEDILKLTELLNKIETNFMNEKRKEE